MKNRGLPRKLTDEQIAEIRAWWRQRQALPRLGQIARKYGIDRNRIYAIGKGFTYKVPQSQLQAMEKR